MRLLCATVVFFVTVPAVFSLQQQAPPSDPAPLYVASSVVNAAQPDAEGLAPNSIGTVYGQFLADSTRAVSAEDLRAGVLPTTLPGTNVRVLIGGQPAPLLFASPGQVNFIVPSTLVPGVVELRVGRSSLFGPAVRVVLRESAPALFRADPESVAFSGPADPRPGDVITLYATGLGETRPRTGPGQVPVAAAPLVRLAEFRVEIGGFVSEVLYAGLAPGYAGVYQVNVRLPNVTSRTPGVRIGFPPVLSPAGVQLRLP